MLISQTRAGPQIFQKIEIFQMFLSKKLSKHIGKLSSWRVAKTHNWMCTEKIFGMISDLCDMSHPPSIAMKYPSLGVNETFFPRKFLSKKLSLILGEKLGKFGPKRLTRI